MAHLQAPIGESQPGVRARLTTPPSLSIHPWRCLPGSGACILVKHCPVSGRFDSIPTKPFAEPVVCGPPLFFSLHSSQFEATAHSRSFLFFPTFSNLIRFIFLKNYFFFPFLKFALNLTRNYHIRPTCQHDAKPLSIAQSHCNIHPLIKEREREREREVEEEATKIKVGTHSDVDS